MNLTHLNCKTKTSLLYGSADLKELIEQVKLSGQSSVGIADYGNIFNAINFYSACIKNYIKPIMGVTLFFVEDIAENRNQKIKESSHITLLAENNIGWKNLVRLCSEAYREENYYFSPKIDFKLLEKYKEGLIILLGPSYDGVISKNLIDELDSNGAILNHAAIFKAEALLRRFLGIFDCKNLFLEVQDHSFPEQKIINDRLRKLGTKYNIRTVYTNNVHYVNKSDAEAHHALLSMSNGTYNKVTRTDFSHEEFFLKEVKEIDDSNILIEEIELSSEIADRCDVEIDTIKRRLPKYKFLPNNHSSSSYLKELAENGLHKLNLHKNKIYSDRLKRELADIDEMGFADYFLIVHDVMSWAHSQNILCGRGRGSAGGSLTSYCLAITDVDPIKYDLIWERFLNKGRGGLPDIDTDFPTSKRQEVLAYIKERFGKENVAQLVTLNGLQARAVLKEVFSIYGMPFEEANKITSLIPFKNEEHSQISLDEAISSVPELQKYEEKYKPWFAIARNLEGCYKSTGLHAAAVVISDVAFEDSDYPLTRSKDGDMIFGWEMKTVEKLSLLKLDILGLNTLDDVQETFALIKDTRNQTLSRDLIPLDDAATFSTISQGMTFGIFQLESNLGRNWAKKIQPSNIEEIASLISLIRPGPLDSGLADNYTKNKNEGNFKSIHEKLTEVTKRTYGQPIYQEQIIFACQKLAGMSLIDSDLVRKTLGKKLPEELKTWKNRFIEGCYDNDISEKEAEDIWEKIEKFAGYSFNASHAIAYALLAYETAYLKTNYPVEFFCAKLKNADGDLEKISALIYEAKLFGISVLPPNIKSASKNFSILNDKSIIFGLSSLKNVGATAIRDIVYLSNKYQNFDDILLEILFGKNKINTAVLEALIKSGTFDAFGEPRVRMLAKQELFEQLTVKEVDLIKDLKNVDLIASCRFICDERNADAIKKISHKTPNINRRQKISEMIDTYIKRDLFDNKMSNILWEKQYLGLSLSGAESDLFKSRDKCVHVANSEITGSFELCVFLEAIRKITTKNNEPMAFATIRDNTYSLDNLVIFPRQFALYEPLLQKDTLLRIYGEIDKRGSPIAKRIDKIS